MGLISEDFLENSGTTLLVSKYNYSLPNLLQNVYPDYTWLPWKFAQTPKHYWDLVQNQRKFMDWIGNNLGIKNMSDWYNIPKKVNNLYFPAKFNE